MTNQKHRIASFVAVAGSSARRSRSRRGGCTGGKAVAAPAKPAAKGAPGPVAAEEMSGVNFEGLTPDQKTLAVSILNENSCDCGCGMKLGSAGATTPSAREPYGWPSRWSTSSRREEPRGHRQAGSDAAEQVRAVRAGAGRVASSDRKTRRSRSSTTSTTSDRSARRSVRPSTRSTRIIPTRPRRLQDAPPARCTQRDARGREPRWRPPRKGKFFEMHKKLFENQQQLRVRST
jgi:hypothetical protein